MMRPLGGSERLYKLKPIRDYLNTKLRNVYWYTSVYEWMYLGITLCITTVVTVVFRYSYIYDMFHILQSFD
jgi:hypothetical protein